MSFMRFNLAVLLTVLAVAPRSSCLVLRYDDARCNTLGSGGDVATVGTADCDSCPTTNCLHLIHNIASTWDAAKEYCEKLSELSDNIENSHLAMILTEEKLDTVKSFLSDLDGNMKPRAAWIGLRSSTALSTCSSWQSFLCLTGATQCACKQWMWLDAVPYSGTPNYWASGQPSGAWSFNGGNCAKMARDHDWRYFDDPCSTSMNFFRQPNAVLCEAAVRANS